MANYFTVLQCFIQYLNNISTREFVVKSIDLVQRGTELRQIPPQKTLSIKLGRSKHSAAKPQWIVGVPK